MAKDRSKEKETPWSEYNLFRCRACSVQLTPVLRTLTEEPKPLRRGVPATNDPIPQGRVWTDPDYRCWDEDSTAGTYLVSHRLARRLVETGGREGCCGPSGIDGINTSCENGHEVGTEIGACGQNHLLVLHHELVVRSFTQGPEVSVVEDALVFGLEQPAKSEWEFHSWLHSALGMDDWFGDDLGALLASWCSEDPEPVEVVWWRSDVARGEGVELEELARISAKYRGRFSLVLL